MFDYSALYQRASALISGVPHRIANLANTAALLGMTLPQINWAGFYLLEHEILVLGPFWGKPACIEIPIGCGVCGTAVAENRTQLVPDVHLFPGHIACDADSRSELVIPLRVAGQIVGVLDLDSPIASRFTEDDRIGLEAIASLLETQWQ